MEFTGCHEPVELRCHAGQLLLPTPAVQWLQQFTSARTHGNASPRCPAGGLGGSARPASGSASPRPVAVGLGRLPTGRTWVLAPTSKPDGLSRAPLTPLLLSARTTSFIQERLTADSPLCLAFPLPPRRTVSPVTPPRSAGQTA